MHTSFALSALSPRNKKAQRWEGSFDIKEELHIFTWWPTVRNKAVTYIVYNMCTFGKTIKLAVFIDEHATYSSELPH